MNALAVTGLPNRAGKWARVQRWRFLLRDCKLFVPQWYREQYPDVARAGIDELTHYLTRGWREGRNPGPEFDGAYYLARYPDVAASGIPPLLHYWTVGRHELRRPNASMDLEWMNAASQRSGERAKLALPESKAQPGDPLMSVIIPTYNRIGMLPGVLDAWREVHRVTQIPYEIVFSDDGSQDGSVAFLESVTDLPIRVLRNAHGGASAARNAAIRVARGQRLLIIGDDIFPRPDLLNVHWELGVEKGPLVATLGVVDWHPELKVNHLMDHITEIGNEQFSYNRLPDGEFVDFRHFYTCNICVDRELLNNQKTLFDHRFDQYGFEDVELGYRLSLQGMRIFYTRAAKGDHFHPYVVPGFCRRQISAGRMAVVFRSVHPGVGAIVGVDEPERALKGGLPAADAERLWKTRLEKLTERAEVYEHLFDLAGRAGRLMLGNGLSAIYVPLFRAMYEYGVLQRLSGTEAVLSIAMARHFDVSWNVYWQILDEPAPDFSGMTRESLNRMVEVATLDNEFVDDPLVAMLAHEISTLAAIQGAAAGAAASRARWRRRISTGFHYLRKDPRQLAHLVRQMLRRRRVEAAMQTATAHRAQEDLTLGASAALVVEPHDAQADALAARFAEAFGTQIRVFERVDEVILRDRSSGESFELDKLPCGVLYWPRGAVDRLPDADALCDAWLAVVENGVDMAVLSRSYGEPAQICADGLRDHLMFSRRVAYAVFGGTLSAAAFSGKVVRIESDSRQAQPDGKPLREWLGARVEIDPVGFFVTDPAPQTTVRYLAPQLPRRASGRPVVFVFPIFIAVGGVERNTVEIIRQLSAHYDFVVVTMERLRLEQGSLGCQFRAAGARIVQMSEFTSHANYLRVLGHLKGWFKPDLVWICNGSPWLGDNALHLRLLFSDVPIVDQQVYDVDQGWINRYGEPGIRSFDRFIAVNRKIYAKFVGGLNRKPSHVDLIYSAVDTDKVAASKRNALSRADVLRKYGLPDGKRLYAFIARLTAQKRPVEFLRLAAARRMHEDECFVLVGDGELALDVDAFMQEEELTNVIRIPYVANTLELDSVLDGLVFTSAYEGLPIAMLEALLLGVPIFATDVGDIGVVLEEFGGGLVYPVHASKADMLAAFECWLAGHGRFRDSLATNEAALLERFSSRRIAKQYVDCFERAMSDYRDGERKFTPDFGVKQ
jgi:glycosyltransferase involved in cell wall biosynthesis